jgi:phosphohistidine phosphatase
MLRLMLLRHAKSSWASPGPVDIERPLSTRGKRAAEAIAETMRERALLPDLILCSPAKRTRETLARVQKVIGDKCPVEIVNELYEPAAGDYRVPIARHGGTAATLLVIGHNPVIQATALSLAASGEAEVRRALARKMPTAALAVIDFPKMARWADLTSAEGSLATFITPSGLDDD